MTRNPTSLDQWLNELGTARQTGLLARSDESNRRFPWKSPSISTAATRVTRVNVGRRALQGFAAAAAVGLALVGVWRLETLWPRTSVDPRGQTPSAIASRDSHSPADAIAGNAKAVRVGDVNGDGKVDGDDIQGFISSQRAPGQADSRDASVQAMTRLLLGN